MTTKKTTKVENETKVMCPVCGSEFVIGEHEHKVKNATVIGADSGLGTVYLNVSRRGEQLKAAGIDPSKYFSITLPTGGSQLMKMGDDGMAVPVTEGDPILANIIGKGTVPNPRLFRRWIMSQMFHALTATDRGRFGKEREIGFTEWLNRHGYAYQWKMMIEELRVQAKLFGKDRENFNARNRWFNKALAEKMAGDYIQQLNRHLYNRPQRTCKGVPYIKVAGYGKGVFVSDLHKKVLAPLQQLKWKIQQAKSPSQLYVCVRDFWQAVPEHDYTYKQCANWKDAYKGMGAYATMENLIRFHGCMFPRNNPFYERSVSSLKLLERAARTYEEGDGWRLLALMKQMLEENSIDIKAKMREWRTARR